MIKKMIILFVVTGGYHRCNSGWPLSAFLHLLKKTCQGRVASICKELAQSDSHSALVISPLFQASTQGSSIITVSTSFTSTVIGIVGVHSFSLAKLNQPSTNPPSPCNLRLLPGLLPHSFKPY